MKNSCPIKVIYCGQTTTATNFYQNQQLSISGKINKLHRRTLKRRDFRGHEIIDNKTKNFDIEESLCYAMLSHFSHVRLCVTPQTAATRLPRPWDSPGKTTGVGCDFLLQCMKVKSESEVAQSCPTPSDPMDCSLPGSSIHGIFQARVLEWGAIAFSEKKAQRSSIKIISHCFSFFFFCLALY